MQTDLQPLERALAKLTSLQSAHRNQLQELVKKGRIEAARSQLRTAGENPHA